MEKMLSNFEEIPFTTVRSQVCRVIDKWYWYETPEKKRQKLRDVNGDRQYVFIVYDTLALFITGRQFFSPEAPLYRTHIWLISSAKIAAINPYPDSGLFN